MLGRTTIFALVFFAAMSVAVVGSESQYVFKKFNPYAAYQNRQHVPVSATAWGIYDMQTGVLLSGVQHDKSLPIASITKLFTGYAVAADNAYEQETSINWHDLYTEGRAGKLSHGDRVTLRELLFPLLIESSNDAAAAIARVMDDSFYTTIENRISALALRNTVIADASGLSAQNVSSPDDLMLFFRYLIDAYPYIVDITTLPLYLSDDNGWRNNSPLHTVSGYGGGKHGFTHEAGKTFVGSFKTKDGAHIGLVLLGSDDLVKDARMLLGEVLISDELDASF